ncbi:MAG: HEAT repeat domain-containing protein [Bacteroidetes bacterium]|nr:HEAT repeat domain-containing protein [Bacteroidota bacterium]
MESKKDNFQNFILCPNCGKKNNANEYKCWKCGIVLSEPSGSSWGVKTVKPQAKNKEKPKVHKKTNIVVKIIKNVFALILSILSVSVIWVVFYFLAGYFGIVISWNGLDFEGGSEFTNGLLIIYGIAAVIATLLILLGSLNKRVLNPLFSTARWNRMRLISPKAGKRKKAIEILGSKKDKKTLDSLIKLLDHESDSNVVIEILKSLSKIGEKLAAGKVAEKLSDEDWSVRQAASKCLQTLGWTPDNWDESILFSIAKGKSDYIDKIKDENLLYYIICNSPHKEMIDKALPCLTSQDLLKKLVVGQDIKGVSFQWDIHEKSVSKISDLYFLLHHQTDAGKNRMKTIREEQPFECDCGKKFLYNKIIIESCTDAAMLITADEYYCPYCQRELTQTDRYKGMRESLYKLFDDVEREFLTHEVESYKWRAKKKQVQ